MHKLRYTKQNRPGKGRMEKPVFHSQPHEFNCNRERCVVAMSFSRRMMLSTLLTIGTVQNVPEPHIQPSLAPDQSKYDPNDQQLRDAYNMLQSGLNAEDVQKEEVIWTEIITRYEKLDEPWVADIVGRAYGNRGNARSRQGRMEQAISDYNKSISICPWSVDPVLNRGVVLENLGYFDEAIRDYRAVLSIDPSDPSAWNNQIVVVMSTPIVDLYGSTGQQSLPRNCAARKRSPLPPSPPNPLSDSSPRPGLGTSFGRCCTLYFSLIQAMALHGN